MKRLFLLSFLLHAVLSLNAQVYNISFAASGASSKVDQVIVQNLTTGTSVTVGGQETLQIKPTNTGIIPLPETDRNSIGVFPNPFSAQTNFEFYNRIAGPVSIELADLNGRTVYLSKTSVSRGTQLFKLKGISQGIYFLRIQTGAEIYNAKLISTGSSNSAISLQSQESIVPKDLQLFAKSASIADAGQSDSGNLLVLNGISGNYRTVVPLILKNDTVVTFDFVPCTDADGNNYAVVKIGEQLWMAENLKTTKYGNGEPIPLVTENSSWSGTATGAFCAYNNKSENSAIYGYLYNWYAAADSSNIAPL